MLIFMQALLGALSFASLPTRSRSFWGIATTSPHPWAALGAGAYADYMLPSKEDIPDDWFWWLLRHSKRKLRRILTADSFCVININERNINFGAALNQYTLVASANPLDRYADQVVHMYARCYATVNRKYRIRRLRRLTTRTYYNPRHWHGETGAYIPLHDLAILTTWGPLYHITTPAHYFSRVMKATIPSPDEGLDVNITMMTAVFKEEQDHREPAAKYRIMANFFKSYHAVNCNLYLPKWWGKFICLSVRSMKELYSGAPLMGSHYGGITRIFGLGCFHWTDGKVKLLVMTDVRHYRDRINAMSDNAEGDYYDYTEIDFGHGHDSGGWYNNNNNDYYDDYWHRAAWRVRNESLPSS